jgi:hypothetical protein
MSNKITIEIEITDQEIDDVLVTALEGGINYWADSADVKDDNYKGGEWASEVVSRGGTLVIQEVDEDEPVELTKEKMLNGIALFIKEYPNLYDPGEELGYLDATGADIIVQLALFETVVYG